VLVAVDFSKPARHAFDCALELSARRGAELVLVQAVPPDEAFSWFARARLALAEQLRERAARAQVAFRERVQSGDPAEIILLHARSLAPEVIIIGTHQRRGLERLRVGSVAERVVTRATVPVLLVPHRPKRSSPPYRHVAVAVDFTATAQRAVEQAFVVANSPGDRITLLHVVPGFSEGVPPNLYRYASAEYQDERVREARRRLQLAVPTSRPTPAAIHTRVLVGDVPTQIRQAVDATGADLLIVGVSRRGVLSRALFGVTASRLLKGGHVPLLGVPGEAVPAFHQHRAASPLAA
jgi:nucleotide-binding universal stress UspA family protein